MDGILRSMRARFHRTDEQYVEQMRRSLRSFDRWRWLLAAFYGLILAAFIVLDAAVVRRLGSLISNLEGRISPAFIVGLVMGFGLALPLVSIVHGLFAMLAGFRTERLLVAYHDALETPGGRDRVLSGSRSDWRHEPGGS